MEDLRNKAYDFEKKRIRATENSVWKPHSNDLISPTYNEAGGGPSKYQNDEKCANDSFE